MKRPITSARGACLAALLLLAFTGRGVEAQISYFGQPYGSTNLQVSPNGNWWLNPVMSWWNDTSSQNQPVIVVVPTSMLQGSADTALAAQILALRSGGFPIPRASDYVEVRGLNGGKVQLHWEGDTRLVNRLYFALLDATKKPVQEQMVTQPPAEAQLTMDKKCVYYYAVVEYVNGTTSTVMAALDLSGKPQAEPAVPKSDQAPAKGPEPAPGTPVAQPETPQNGGKQR